MASLDRPKHGWEGISNGGEIWGNGNSGNSHYFDGSPDELREILKGFDPKDDFDFELGGSSPSSKVDTANMDFGAIDDFMLDLEHREQGINSIFDNDYSYQKQLTFGDKRKKMIDVLNRYNELPEIANITDSDFERIITLYEEENLRYGVEEPWNHTDFADVLIIQKCLYEVIKNNSSYYSLMVKLEGLFEKEFNREIDRINNLGEYKVSYSDMPEYSMVLADMCCRQMEEFQTKYAKTSDVSFPEHSLETYKAIKSDLEKVGISMSETNESIALGTEELISVEKAYDAAKEEKQRLAKEIEAAELEQGILKIRIEILEIEKRIKMIKRDTLGSSFDEWVSIRYPDEYQAFLQQEKQLKGRNSNQSQVDDLKSKFEAVTSELQLLQNVLPAFETIYQRYNEMKEEDKKAFALDKEHGRIYNLIFSEENERLRKSNSIYTAWDLSDKKIPFRFRDKTYEEVEAMLLQEREEKRLSDEARSSREALIEKAVRKEVGVDDSYRLHPTQIENLRKKFDPYTDDELEKFILGEELGVKPKTPIIFEDSGLQLNSMNDSNAELEKKMLIDDILALMYPDGSIDVYSTLAAKQLQSSGVEELRVIKEEWERASLSNKSGRGM